MFAFLRVILEDNDPSKFKGLELSAQHLENPILFESGDPLIDWYNFSNFLYSGEAQKQGITSMLKGQTVNEWFLANENYREVFLDKWEGNFTILENLAAPKTKRTLCVVNKEMNSFDDLKKYCQDKVAV